ncbi:MAG: polyribonucleotide nucleotidyltransferase [candidate division SR1 bacterium]|nr:polyribonucleotide nucleotidyltransferase [candidate division SR1 bacterium]
MFKQTPYTHSIDFHGQKLTLETGLLAKQATSSVLATMGQTTVIAAVVVGQESHADYFPLQIIYEERLYAAGKIKGSRFIKREGRPSDASVLAGRMVDRSLRSLFDPYIRNEIQVVITILSVDEINSPDTLAVLAASSALSLCGISGFAGPVSSVRIGQSELGLISSPSYVEQSMSDLDLVISGDGVNIMMVEAGGNIISEEIIGEGLELANTELTVLNKFQNDFINLVPAKKTEVVSFAPAQKYIDLFVKNREYWEKAMYTGPIKMSGNEAYNTLIKTLFEDLKNAQAKTTNEQEFLKLKADDSLYEKEYFQIADTYTEFMGLKPHLEHAIYEAVTHIVRDNIITNDKRLDGRKLDETRTITCQTDVLPHTHGSSLFNRGETQVLNVLTLGTNRDAQTLDDMEDFEEQTKRYIHHYNFPAYSVGETGRYFGPGRREIGHGALAEKALLPVLPSEDDFPYTMRLVSECLGSNGSTSMASTCGSCLSLMAGGVPIKDMVAGVAMGLMLDVKTGNYKVVTDIQGFEDHHGDMDFKVTGTKDGITALQLDNKVAGLTVEVLKDALTKGKVARLHILDIMKQEIATPKTDISQYAPRVAQIEVPFEKIGEVIGPSGKIIKGIIAKTGVQIEIDDLTGRTLIYGKEAEKVNEAKNIVLSLIKEYAPGDTVTGKVYRLEPFGAFVKIDGSEKEGLVHISESSAKGERVKDIKDIFKLEDEVNLKIIAVNERGQISCTRKGVE